MARQRKAAQPAEGTLAQESTEPDTLAGPIGNGPSAAGGDASSPAAREPGNHAPEKSWVKSANVIVDPEAGIKLHFDYEHHKAVITFNEKPSAELLAVAKPILKQADFRWDTESEPAGWSRKIRFENREEHRRESKKAFYAVANAVRQIKGLPARAFGEALGF